MGGEEKVDGVGGVEVRKVVKGKVGLVVKEEGWGGGR